MAAPAMHPSGSSVLTLSQRCRSAPLIFDGIKPELCASLEQVILDRMKTDRRRTGSINVGGWKSAEDFFSWPDASVQQLRQIVVAETGAPRPIGWAMVNRVGSHHPRHQHLAAILFGIYYVTPGNEDAITPTIFECDDAGSKYDLEVEPHPGRLVVARGDMWHRVPPYPGELPRITVAFDIRR